MGKSDHSIQKNGLIIGTITIIICIGIGLYFYHNFFRQTNAQLIETVPTDAVFIFQVNENRGFVSELSPFSSYMNDLFNFQSFPGFEFFMDQLQESKNNFIISGHLNGEKYAILYTLKISESQFGHLIEQLKIDPRNFQTFDDTKVYVYGTHFKKFNFTYHDGFFSISEDSELLKKSIVQLKSLRNLLAIGPFEKIYEVVSKNTKQNWLIVNNRLFLKNLNQFINQDFQGFFDSMSDPSSWSAFQVRFNDNEVSLLGYTTTSKEFEHLMAQQEVKSNPFGEILPFNTHFYSILNTPDPPSFLKYFQNNKKMELSYSNYNRLQSESSIYFSLNQDSLTYYYMGFKCDTTTTLLDIQHPDSLLPNTQVNPYPILASSLTDVYPHMNSMFKSEPLSYFIHYKGYYIFSSSKEALKYYLKVVPNNNIESNPYYRFAKTNLPTSTTFEFFLASQTIRKWERYLNSTTQKMSIPKNLKLITYSYSQPKDQLMGVNIFIKF